MQSMKEILGTLFKPQEQQMEATIAGTAEDGSAPLTKAMQAAKDFFADRPYIEQVAVIEVVGDKTEADLSVVDRQLGNRITVRVAVTDRLEADAMELATRFSNTRTETVRC